MRATGILTVLLMSIPSVFRGQALRSVVMSDRSAAGTSSRLGLAAGLDSVLAPDAILVLPGTPILSSRASILDFLGRQPAQNLLVQWDATYAELSPDSAFAVFYGSVFQRSADTVGGIGRFASAWRRTVEGPWKLVALWLTGVPTAPPVLAHRDSAAMDILSTLDPTSPFSRADEAFADRALRNGASDAFSHFAAPDAVLLGTGNAPMLRGSRIGVRMKATGADRSRWKWWPVFAFGDAAGTVGATIGQAEIADTAPGGDIGYSEYMTLWHRAADGTLQFIADAGNPWPRPPSPSPGKP